MLREDTKEEEFNIEWKRKLTFIEAQEIENKFKKEIGRLQRSIAYSNGFLRSFKERYGIR